MKFKQIAYVVEQKYAGRYNRSVLGVRSDPVQGIALQFAHDLYAHKGLRATVLARWNRIGSMTNRERIFYTDVRRYLAMIDEGEIEPVDPSSYVH